MIKAVTLFLLVMLLIGLVGNALFPGALSGMARRKTGLDKARRCPKCNRYRVGKSDCSCGGK